MGMVQTYRTRGSAILAQDHIDTRAIEMASAVQAVMNLHLAECRDRYLAVDKKLDTYFQNQNRLLIYGGGAIIGMLISVIAYLVSHGGIPVVH